MTTTTQINESVPMRMGAAIMPVIFFRKWHSRIPLGLCIFAYNTEIWDTLKMARQTIGKQESYIAWCVNNGYLTKHKVPRVRLTAEILYRYLSGNKDFIESHTGLEDVIIETKIMAHCLRQHKKLKKRLY